MYHVCIKSSKAVHHIRNAQNLYIAEICCLLLYSRIAQGSSRIVNANAVMCYVISACQGWSKLWSSESVFCFAHDLRWLATLPIRRLYYKRVQAWCRDGVENTVKEKPGILSLIRMLWFPSADSSCRQSNFCNKILSIPSWITNLCMLSCIMDVSSCCCCFCSSHLKNHAVSSNWLPKLVKSMVLEPSNYTHTQLATILRPLIGDYPGEQVPKETFTHSLAPMPTF